MLTEERFAKILSILEHMGSVTVQQLMTELDASESTVRRDLNTLDANGRLVKVHGGAILKNTVYSTIDDEVVYRKEQNREAKDKIARYAAGLITAEDFVYIDAGTTTERMIDYIANRQAVFGDERHRSREKAGRAWMQGLYSGRRVQGGDRGYRR